jgi:plasmid stabilization system protein ParE
LRWNLDTLKVLEVIYAIRARCDPAAARSFVFRVAEGTGRLLTLPTSGRPGITKGMWLLAVPGTPYVIVYRVEGETVDILSMLSRQVQSRGTPIRVLVSGRSPVSMVALSFFGGWALSPQLGKRPLANFWITHILTLPP